jgi:Bacterial capsule synthesis protein PGA_cap
MLVPHRAGGASFPGASSTSRRDRPHPPVGRGLTVSHAARGRSLRRRDLPAPPSTQLPLRPPPLVHSSGTRLALVAALALASLAPRDAGAQRLRRARGVRVCAGGDVTLGTNLPTYATRETASIADAPVIDTIPSPWRAKPHRLLAPLRPLVKDADVLLVNVEGAIGDGETGTKCGPFSTSCFAFRMPPAAAPALRKLAGHATVVGNVANNHSRDAGLDGLDSTAAHLERAGVVVTGADTLPSIAVTAKGDTVAFLGFATSGAGTPDVRDLDAVRRHVARASERWPRLVVTMHAGAEGRDAQRTRDTTERYANGDRGNAVAFAHAAVESGADLVVGHGPHVLRAVEWRGTVPVFYSLGNLVTYGPFSNKPPIDRGAIACAVLDDKGRARSATLRATVQQWPGHVARDKSRRAYALVDSLSQLDFPRTGARVHADGAVVRRPSRKSRTTKPAKSRTPTPTKPRAPKPAASR